MNRKATLLYFHDPMCSWCWGFRPVWDEIQKIVKDDFPLVDVAYIAGGLAPDNPNPMPDNMQAAIEGHWRRISAELGTTFNHEFWSKNTPRRSTYHACRAVLAAKRQQSEQRMINAIQEGYYLRALNPSDETILIQLAGEFLNQNALDKFSTDLRSADIDAELQQQVTQYRKLQIEGAVNGFPSLVLEVEGKYHSIAVNYKDADAMLTQIHSHLV